VPGVGIGMPRVALRLLSEEDKAIESENASGSTGLIMKDGREKNLKLKEGFLEEYSVYMRPIR